MSEQLSAEEKRRLLRERRQAKMAKGNATNRLNNILNQGSSVKETEAVSVLDEPKKESVSPQVTDESSRVKSGSPGSDEDPQVSDITSLMGKSSAASGGTEDIDEIFSKVFGQNMPSSAAGSDDIFSQMMGNAFKQAGSAGSASEPTQESEEAQYSIALNKYNLYQRKLWSMRFLVVRYLTILANYVYHYVTLGNSFKSSSYGYIRSNESNGIIGSFYNIFLACELVFLTSFHLISLNNKLYDVDVGGNWILKGLSFVSSLTPKLERFRPIILQLIKYKILFEMFLEDVCLIVVLVGLSSHI